MRVSQLVAPLRAPRERFPCSFLTCVFAPNIVVLTGISFHDGEPESKGSKLIVVLIFKGPALLQKSN
jgi:hypothetical protein